MNIIEYLEKKTGYRIATVLFNSPIKVFYGLDGFESKIFIKVFDSEHNYNQELQILKLLGRKIIFTDTFEDKYIICVDYLKVDFLDSLNDVSVDFVKEAARVIANFHNTDISSGDFYSPSLYELLDYYYLKIDSTTKNGFEFIYDYFIDKKNQIEEEENKLEKKLLQGSFMNDTIGYHNGKLILFDFESALVQTPWYEFVLAYNSRLGLGDIAKPFLEEYNKHVNLQPISEDMLYLLRLITLCRLQVYSTTGRTAGIPHKLLASTKINLLNKLQLYIM